MDFVVEEMNSCTDGLLLNVLIERKGERLEKIL
jgi:hypothetical protein